MVKEIFSRRLKSIRIMRGLSIRELCARMDNPISSNAIAKYEQGKMFPNSTVLIALSKALDVPMDDLLRPITVNIDTGQVKYRKRPNLGKKEEEAIKSLVSLKLERYLEMENMCGESKAFSLSYPDVEVSCDEDAISVASRFRADLRVGDAPIVNPMDLLEGLGVKIIEIDAPDSFDGSSFTVGDSFVVVPNRNFDPERIRMSLFHEIGHKVMNFSGTVNGRLKEKLCTVFAGEVLLPSSVLINNIGTKRKDIAMEELKSLQCTYGISIDDLMDKAKALGIISGKRYTTYCDRKETDSAFKEYATKSLYAKECSYRYRNLVCRLYSNEVITISKCASLLGCSVSDVRKDIQFV